MVLLLVASLSGAQVLDSAIQTEEGINDSARQTQQRIDQISEQTEELLNEYRQVVSETESLQVYNAHLEGVVQSQRDEIESINRQLSQLEDTQKAVVPLMVEMVDTLGDIVEGDMPFRKDQRTSRVEDMKLMLDRSDVTNSEKFRRILDVYQGEIDYGRTTETYRGELPGGEKVDFLRVGRTLLLYQSLDGETTGWWNPQSRTFEQLGDEYRIPVKDGLAIADNRRAPDLVKLPVPAPEDAE